MALLVRVEVRSEVDSEGGAAASGVDSSLLLCWLFDVAAGSAHALHDSAHHADSATRGSTSSTVGVIAPMPWLQLSSPRVVSITSLRQKDLHGHTLTLLVHQGAGGRVCASLFPPQSESVTRASLQEQFFHTIDYRTGLLQTFAVRVPKFIFFLHAAAVAGGRKFWFQ